MFNSIHSKFIKDYFVFIDFVIMIIDYKIFLNHFNDITFKSFVLMIR